MRKKKREKKQLINKSLNDILLSIFNLCLRYLFLNMLKGIKVLEFEGLAPTVFCGMYFADQGAEVILVARIEPAPFSMPIEVNLMNRGKKCILLSPKIKKDK